jgi:hypothetical protein
MGRVLRCYIYIVLIGVRFYALPLNLPVLEDKGLALKVLTGDTVQFFNRVIGQSQASAGYILSKMLNR